jgi:hypothetical protein
MKSPLPAARVAELLGTYRKQVPQGITRKQAANFHRLQNLGRHGRKILSDESVRQIRKRYDAQEKLQSIADDFGVTKECVCMIGRRQRRAGVKP